MRLDIVLEFGVAKSHAGIQTVALVLVAQHVVVASNAEIRSLALVTDVGLVVGMVAHSVAQFEDWEERVLEIDAQRSLGVAIRAELVSRQTEEVYAHGSTLEQGNAVVVLCKNSLSLLLGNLLLRVCCNGEGKQANQR